MSPSITSRPSRRRRLGVAAAGGAALLAVALTPPGATASGGGGGGGDDDARHGQRTYRVTIVNLTGGQPLTPPLLATHSRRADVFDVGDAASEGVKEVAENGNLAPLQEALEGNRYVHDVVVGGVPVVPEGRVGPTDFPNATTLTIEASRRAHRLSWVSMLICTNDGFTGVDSLHLPHAVGRSTTRMTRAYDAGTERNTEAFGDIVPPCQGLIGVTGGEGTGESDPSIAENRVIRHHRGIKGHADLQPDVHGWRGPVAQVTVTRIS